MKRMTAALLCVLLVFSLAACGGSKTPAPSELEPPGESAPAHERLMYEVGSWVEAARQQADVGCQVQSEYSYAMAQAEISSLRQTVDTILWLKGEGESLSDLVGTAPYTDWDAVVGAGLGSDAPFYFEGLLFTIQGKDAEAQECYQKAAANPNHTERDFYYLKAMTVEELYALRESASELETSVWEEYTPQTALVSPRTGAEFAPAYHLSLIDGQDSAQAYQCAVNALLANPAEVILYSTAVCYALDDGQAEAAQNFLNEGLWVFPEDGLLNYLAASICAAQGDKQTAQTFLNIAKANADSQLQEQIAALEAQMGG